MDKPLNYQGLPSQQKKFGFIGLSGLIGLAIAFSIGNWMLSIGIIMIPSIIIFLLYILEKPIYLFYFVFILNYIITGITRYVSIDGISVIMDGLLIALVILIFIHGCLKQNIEWKNNNNILFFYALIWMGYCILQLANPTGMIEAWISSRGLIFNALIVTFITISLIKDTKEVKTIITIYSILTLLGAGKALMQKFIGFDLAEQIWLAKGGAVTHIIATGTRYFSFFTDAGNFGSNMGCSGIVFGIIAFYSSSIRKKVYFLFVSALATYAMFLSGTRGAIIVPLGGLLLYILISKNYKAMVLGSVTLVFIYVFFAFTSIGQSNAQIRRMRSAFQPTEDASFNVRRENQKILGTYLKNKPFGEGLGLSGVENLKISNRLTTQIPNDSWYVKIWVETGIIGAILYIGGLFIIIGRCAWIIMFKLKGREFKGYCSGLLCGILGLLLSAYGNAFWGQYPTMIFAFTGMAICLNGEYIENKSTNHLITSL